MFTKSQFEKVADVLVKSAPRAYGPESRQHWETVKAFMEEFTENNPKFDQGKFLTYMLSKLDEQQMLAFQAAVDGKPVDLAATIKTMDNVVPFGGGRGVRY
jgi:hypothetical protein